MPLSDWFKARENRRYTVTTPPSADRLPDGVWVKCPSCKHTLYQGDLERALGVCPHCGHHQPLSAPERIDSLADSGTFEETEVGLASVDPLHSVSGKAYRMSLAQAREATGLSEAIITGRALIGGHPTVIGAMDFRFIGASMGSAVGEKVARAFAQATAEGRAVVLVIASGGARMQEGMLSLMQMAKTAAAARTHAAAGLPYLAVLTNPTYGGVTASFATLADVILAEPGSMVGFAGPALVEQTIRQSPPKGFQTAESLVGHGMIDGVVPRGELADTIALLLDYLTPPGVPDASSGAACTVRTAGGAG